jgi:hypothetical protein
MKNELLLILTMLFTLPVFSQKNITTVQINKQVSLTSTIETFDILKHSYDTCDTGLGWKSICLVDGKIFYGTDAGMKLPINQLLKLSLIINKHKIDLDVSGLYNPNWNNEIRKDQFNIEKQEVGYELSGFFSDGAGAYSVIWKIVKNKSLRISIKKED